MGNRARRRYSIGVAVDWFFFVFAGLAAIWLAYLSFTETFKVGWWGVLFAIAFWVLLAYLVLPRLHRILTTIYVPEYFIGRARTSDGLLGDPVNLALLGDADQIHHVMRLDMRHHGAISLLLDECPGEWAAQPGVEVTGRNLFGIRNDTDEIR